MPFEVITLDLVVGPPKSEGSDVVLVVMDKLTKYVSHHQDIKSRRVCKAICEARSTPLRAA